MPRRVSLPGADELFRSTTHSRGAAEQPPAEPVPAGDGVGASGRVRHDEKMTIYVTAAELLAVEQARLRLRAELGKKVDRGRLVRAALALALEDLETRGLDSDLTRRLMEQ